MTKQIWTKEWPTEAGTYWFYGWRFGNEGLNKDDEPELNFVEVSKIVNGFMYITRGHWLTAEKGYEGGAIGLWTKAIVPELPSLDNLTK
jgi:hypothetical protein